MLGKLVVLVLVAAVAAGCVQNVPAAGMPAADDMAASGAAAFSLGAEGCVEGGGYSVYNYDGGSFVLPSPWMPIDVSEDLGDPAIGSYFIPITADGVTGIYHTTIVCDSWTFDGETREDLVMGFVGIRVQPPPFDDGTAQHHYLLDVLSVADADVRDALGAAGVHVTAGSGVFELVGGLLHTTLADEHHGLYETVIKMKEHRDMDAGPVRLWIVHEAEGGGYRPTSIDLVNAGGRHWVAEGTGYFHHLFTEDHAPLPAANGNVAGLAFTGFSREVRLGPAPDVVLAESWSH